MKNTIKLISIIMLIISLAACSNKTSSSVSESVVEIETELTNSSAALEAEEAASIVETVNIEHVEINETQADYTWDAADEIAITLDDDSISSTGQDVIITGSTATITSASTYRLSGSLSNGQILVDTEEEGIVRLILDGVDISNSSGPAIYIREADKAMIVLAEGSRNLLSDGSNYELEADSDEPNATLFSTADLILYGSGLLTVQANYNDGIASKDGLLIASGNLSITALDDGLRGKDYVYIKEGNFEIKAGGDGIKSDAEEDASKGFITIETGSINITANGDAIAAETDVSILGGSFDLTSGGGSSAYVDESTSAKGIKGGNSVTIANGAFTINAADDAVHSNNSIVIDGGSFEIATGDDGMHADTSLTFNDGQINISQSYEGLESAVITIIGGKIHLTASDDGINLADGADGSGTNQPMQPGAMPEDGRQRPGAGGGPGMDMFAGAGDYALYIHGGEVFVNADGDGIDSNGSIEITGGLVLINGPTENMNGALDYMGTFNISGGTLIAVGSAGMAQAPGTGSTQNSVIANFSSTISAGTLVHLQDSSGKAIFTFVPAKNFQSIVFSMSDLALGETYTLFGGGTISGEETYGLYPDGTYSGGIEVTNFTISSVVTQLGGAGAYRR